MRIGIDISQIVYEGTGVGTYVRELVKALLALDQTNEYVLFASSLRKKHVVLSFYKSLGVDSSRVKLSLWSIPPTILDVMWNRLHMFPISWFIGKVDVFWSSDWTQPPLGAVSGVTTIHDLSVLRYPRSFHSTILAVQKRRLARAKRECSTFLCDSLATKKDMIDFLKIDEAKIHVVYPGFSFLTI